uniref:Uncharacterized protein n=1 Tax=Arundo donax TaxID=35708 RepID=A0A0A9ENG0_ARUDO
MSSAAAACRKNNGSENRASGRGNRVPVTEIELPPIPCHRSQALCRLNRAPHC